MPAPHPRPGEWRVLPLLVPAVEGAVAARLQCWSRRLTSTAWCVPHQRQLRQASRFPAPACWLCANLPGARECRLVEPVTLVGTLVFKTSEAARERRLGGSIPLLYRSVAASSAVFPAGRLSCGALPHPTEREKRRCSCLARPQACRGAHRRCPPGSTGLDEGFSGCPETGPASHRRGLPCRPLSTGSVPSLRSDVKFRTPHLPPGWPRWPLGPQRPHQEEWRPKQVRKLPFASASFGPRGKQA